MSETLRKAESSYEILKTEKKVHDGLGRWLPNHSDKRIVQLPYDRNLYRNQRISESLIEPTPSLEKAYMFGSYAIGEKVFGNLVSALKESGSANLAEARANNGQNTLIVTAHTQGTMDTAVVHAATFCAVGNKSFAYNNGIFVNYLMSRMGIQPEPEGEIIEVLNALRVSGFPIKVLANTQSAINAGIDKRTIREVNGYVAPILDEKLSQGMVTHLAPTRTVAEETDYGWHLPTIRDGFAKFINDNFTVAVGIPMWLSNKPNMSRFNIVDPVEISIHNLNDVHTMMERMAAEVSILSGGIITYDSPPGVSRNKRFLGSIASNQARLL